MWLSSGDSIATANLWWFLGILATALVSATVTIYTLRSRPKDAASYKEIAKAIDEALELQSRMIVEPLQLERDTYRTWWQACVKGRRRD